MELILLIIAPVAQIILSTLRVMRVIGLRLYWIAPIALFSGFILSYISMNLVMDQIVSANLRCGMPALGMLFGGAFITMVTVPIIYLIFYLIDRVIRKKEVAAK